MFQMKFQLPSKVSPFTGISGRKRNLEAFMFSSECFNSFVLNLIFPVKKTKAKEISHFDCIPGRKDTLRGLDIIYLVFWFLVGKRLEISDLMFLIENKISKVLSLTYDSGKKINKNTPEKRENVLRLLCKILLLFCLTQVSPDKEYPSSKAF